jgi:hypothetical protein
LTNAHLLAEPRLRAPRLFSKPSDLVANGHLDPE